MSSETRPADQAQAREMFERLVSLPLEQRRTLLEELGRDNPMLREAVVRLLSADESCQRSTETMHRPEDALRDAFARIEPPEEILESGAAVAGYTILELIGQGGMGAVYKARQLATAREVALKLIRPGLMNRELIRRFELEAEYLARLDHDGIATIHDAGVAQTPLGRQPYFAMEYVRGRPLDEYVRAHGAALKLRQRVELYTRICQAVQHAHSRGIVHRDLKPDNILVDADGQPKIIDFGVARATESDASTAAAATANSQSGQVIGTVPYMAPEQIRGQTREIGHATDVYALGVIGFELFTGTMPYRVTGVPTYVAAKAICEDEPTRLESINRELRGDIATIVGKALEKDKSRRYPTAAELAGDVKRYLDYQPITARPPSAWYRLAKFVRRNKVAVGAATLVFIALTVGVIGATVGLMGEARQRAIAQAEAKNAKDEAAKLEAVNSFLADMLTAADPDRMLGERVTVLQALEVAIEKLREGSLRQQPLVAASIQTAIGSALGSLGRFKESEAMLREALSTTERLLPANHRDVARSAEQLGHTLWMQSKSDEAEALQRRVLEIARTATPRDDRDIGQSLVNLGSTLHERGKYPEAESVLREGLALYRRSLPAEEAAIAHCLNNLGLLFKDSGKHVEAERALREALDLRQKILPAGHRLIATSANNLAQVLQEQARFEDAEKLFRLALEVHRQVLPQGHPRIGASLNNLAVVLQAQKRFAESEPLYQEALEILTESFGADHLNTATCKSCLAWLLRERGVTDRAEVLYREVLATYRAKLPANHPLIAVGLNSVAGILSESGRDAEAFELYHEALSIRRKAFPNGHGTIATTLNNIAGIHLRRADLPAAEPLLSEALEMARIKIPTHPDLAYILMNVGRLRELQGKIAEAEALFREALEMRTRLYGPGSELTNRSALALAGVLDAVGRQSEAQAIRKSHGVSDLTDTPSSPATRVSETPTSRPTL
jgi:serine/threonine protein kinase/Tfp pilus assembly protein PilF